MYEDIKVSVITPTYNDERFIKETLLSILNQTHSNLEVLVVDDCSTDSTVEIIKSINDDRIKLFVNDKNQGAAYSRNLAISKATGEYIAFLDGDDMWEKSKTKKQLDFMIKNNYFFSYAEYCLMSDSGTKSNVFFTGPKKVTHKMLAKTNYIGCLTSMYKRELYPDLCIPSTIKKRNDYALWLKLTEKTDCFLYPDVVAFYRKREKDSISSSKKKALLKHHKKMFAELYNIPNFIAFLFAIRNAFYLVLRRFKYQRKFKQ